MTSLVTSVRRAQVIPPSPVINIVPWLPTAQPRFWLRKKTECSQASVPVCCFAQEPVCENAAELERSKSNQRDEQRLIARPNLCALNHKICSPTLILLSLKPATGENASKGEQGREAHNLLESLELVAGNKD